MRLVILLLLVLAGCLDKEAVQRHSAIIAKSPQDPLAYFARARVYAAEDSNFAGWHNHGAEAMADLDRALSLARDNPKMVADILCVRGIVLWEKLEDPVKAEADLARSAAIEDKYGHHGFRTYADANVARWLVLVIIYERFAAQAMADGRGGEATRWRERLANARSRVSSALAAARTPAQRRETEQALRDHEWRLSHPTCTACNGSGQRYKMGSRDSRVDVTETDRGTEIKTTTTTVADEWSTCTVCKGKGYTCPGRDSCD